MSRKQGIWKNFHHEDRKEENKSRAPGSGPCFFLVDVLLASDEISYTVTDPSCDLRVIHRVQMDPRDAVGDEVYDLA